MWKGSLELEFKGFRFLGGSILRKRFGFWERCLVGVICFGRVEFLRSFCGFLEMKGLF